MPPWEEAIKTVGRDPSPLERSRKMLTDAVDHMQGETKIAVANAEDAAQRLNDCERDLLLMRRALDALDGEDQVKAVPTSNPWGDEA